MLLKQTCAIVLMIVASAGLARAETTIIAAVSKVMALEHAGLGKLSTDLPDNFASLQAKAVVTPSISYTTAWLKAQPVASGGAQWECLTEALYFEARGKAIKGQFAVAEVIMNRVDSRIFPDTICGVVNQGTGRRYQCQFTYTCDGIPEIIHEPAALINVGKVARIVIDGAERNLTNGATHYHTTAVNPRWARVYKHTTSIGVHRFYRKPS